MKIFCHFYKVDLSVSVHGTVLFFEKYGKIKAKLNTFAKVTESNKNSVPKVDFN